MIVKGVKDPEQTGRTFYPLDGFEASVAHFVTRVTTPDSPFVPHKHEQKELWYILEGAAIFSRDGHEERVDGGDLILIEPWVEHGLRTDSCVSWICLG